MNRAGTEQQPKSEAGAGLLLLAVQGLLISLFLNPWLLALLSPAYMANSPRRLFVAGAIHVIGLLLFGVVLLRWRWLGKTRGMQWAFERCGRLVNAMLALGTLSIMVLLLDWVGLGVVRLRETTGASTYFRLEREGTLLQPDSLYGWRGVPGGVQRARAVLLRDGRTLFDVTYHLNEQGWRVVPQEAGPKDAHMVFLGCSFTFGDGCEDDETLPAQVACLRPRWHVYNTAHRGYSPAQALLQLQTGALNGIESAAGVAVFRLIGDHVNRLVPGRLQSSELRRYSPLFQLDVHGDPVYVGAMWDHAMPIMALNDFLCSLNTAQAVRLDTVVPFRHEHALLAASILRSAQAEYLLRYPGGSFLVLLDPTCHGGDFDVMGFQRALTAQGVMWLDPVGLYGSPPDARYHFEGDGHPTPEAQAVLAAWLVEQLDTEWPTLRAGR